VQEPYQLEGSDKTGNPGVFHQTAEWHGMFDTEMGLGRLGINNRYELNVAKGRICGRCSRNREERLLE
jgi:hypothetical protein